MVDGPSTALLALKTEAGAALALNEKSMSELQGEVFALKKEIPPSARWLDLRIRVQVRTRG